MKSLVAVALLAVALTTALVAYGMRQELQPVSGRPLPFKTIYWSQGLSDSITSTPQNLVINDNNTWTRVYAQDLCGIGNDCVPVESVNFTSSTVLAVFAGWRPHAGYLVNITQVSQDGEVILVQILFTLPGLGPPSNPCLWAQALTHPYHIVSIPKTDLPVTFSARSIIRQCPYQ